MEDQIIHLESVVKRMKEITEMNSFKDALVEPAYKDQSNQTDEFVQVEKQAELGSETAKNTGYRDIFGTFIFAVLALHIVGLITFTQAGIFAMSCAITILFWWSIYHFNFPFYVINIV